MDKIRFLIESSKKVIRDCSLENGAIVAARSDKADYPKEAKHYTYVWPRDAAYICVVAMKAGIKDIQEPFFQWCLERAEGFSEIGLFYEKYYVNGLKAQARFQVDQTATVIWAVHEFCRGDEAKQRKYKQLVMKAADAISCRWNGTCFVDVTNDLWEERYTFPDQEENFTYSLAACFRGLICANEMFPNPDWLISADSMRQRLDEHYDPERGHFTRTFGKIHDKRIDASMLGLVFPFEIIPADDERMKNTVKAIEEKLNIDGGIHRYEHDEYDGWMYHTLHRKKGAGGWPILNFWAALYYDSLGDRENFNRHFNWVLEKVDKHLPEQIFDNDIQVSVSPLAWSHAMFLFCCERKGLL